MVFVTMFVGYACYGYNRKGVSLALPKLMEEGLKKEHAGLIVSCQNLAYAVSKFAGGILSDQLSARRLFSCGLILSGIATLLFGSANSIGLFCTYWFLNGFAQGAGWPSCAKIIRQWYHPSQFGTWWSILSASTNVSGGIAPFVVTWVILHHGWRASLFVAGGVSVAMGLISLFTLFNSPLDLGLPSPLTSGDSSSTNKKTDEEAKPTKAAKEGGLADLLRSFFLWLIAGGYLIVFAAKTAAVDWGQVYLMDEHKHSAYDGSTLTSSIESGGFFGGILAGMVTDVLVARHNRRLYKNNARIPIAVFCSLIAAGCFHLLVFNVDHSTSKIYIAGLGAVLGASLYGNITLFGIIASESAPFHLSGSSHALAALAGNIGAIVSGLPLSMLASAMGWRSVFLLLEVFCATAAVVLSVLLRVDARIARHLHQD